MPSWGSISNIFGALKSVGAAIQEVPPTNSTEDPKKLQHISDIAKELTSLDAQLENLITKHSELKDNLAGDKTIDKKFGRVKSLLDEAYEKVENAELEVGGITAYVKGAAKAILTLTGGGSWISYKPKIDQTLEETRIEMNSLEDEFNKLIEKYKKAYTGVATLNEKQSLDLRNEFKAGNESKEGILVQMVRLCKKIQNCFSSYAKHKVSVSKIPTDGKIDLGIAAKALAIYVSILNDYAGHDLINNMKGPVDLTKSIRVTTSNYGPEDCFGKGAIAKLFDTIYQQMFEKANEAFKCWDGKCVLESRSGS